MSCRELPVAAEAPLVGRWVRPALRVLDVSVLFPLLCFLFFFVEMAAAPHVDPGQARSALSSGGPVGYC